MMDPLPDRPASKPWQDETMEVIGWLFEEMRRALGSGHFRPAVRVARHLDVLIHFAAIREEREMLMNPAPPMIVPTDWRFPE